MSKSRIWINLIIASLILFYLLSPNLHAQNYTDINAGLTPVDNGSVAWGDLNNNGYLDIVLTGLTDNDQYVTRIYYNNGDNTFTEYTGSALTGVIHSSVALFDYDNDGYIDVLLSGWTSSVESVTKIYRNNGDNTFTEQTHINLTGVNYPSVTWGDYNNDGLQDILLSGVSNTGSVTQIYRNNGDNTFTLQHDISLTGITGGSVRWGDYDNDGYSDILLSGYAGTGPVSKIYHNNGDGTFTYRDDVVLPGISQGSAEWGDYDNDGYLDILLTGSLVSGWSTSLIFRNNADGTFTQQTSVSLPPVSIGGGIWGDYDNDGLLDIFLSGYSSSGIVSKIFRNNGNNSFTEQTDIILEGVFFSSASWGDYDNDGDLDLLITGENSSGDRIAKIYRNETEVSNIPPAAPESLISKIEGAQVILSWDSAIDNETPSAGLSYNVRVGASSGDSDIVNPHSLPSGQRKIVSLGNAQSNTRMIIKNLKRGSYYWSLQTIDNGFSGGAFSQEQMFEITTPVQASEVTASNSGGISQPLQWHRGNGTKCAVFMREGNQGSVVLTDNATYVADESFGTGSGLPDGWYCVYNGDGSSVTVTGLIPYSRYICQVIEYEGSPGNESYFTISGNNNPSTFRTSPFVEQTGIVLPPTYYSISEWGDYNNDNHMDLFFGGINTSSRIFENNGSNGFTPGNIISSFYNGSAAWGDYNNNGYLDLLITGADFSNNPVTKLYVNNGDDTFTEHTDIELSAVKEGDVAWGDFDNDGDLDILLTGNTGLSRVAKIYRNNGDGTFHELAGTNLTGVSNSSVDLADYDRDGHLDILITGQDISNNPVTMLYRNNGDNTFTEQVDILLTNVFYSSVAWSDFDNDGYPDILITGASSIVMHNPAYPVTKVYRNNGEGNFTEISGLDLKGVYHSSAAWVDYDNDGYPDIFITGNSESGYVSRIYRNNGDNTFTWLENICLPRVVNGSLALADYDNDGKTDLLITGYTGSKGLSRIYKNLFPVSNTPPLAPTELTASVNGTILELLWSPSSDQETPSEALTYNVRVGKTPGGTEVVSPMSSPSGFRRIPEPGNTGYDTVKMLNNLFPGEYYWSVQAVDNGMKGSPFASEQFITIDSIQAHNLTATIISKSSLSLRWSRGNGQRCVVFCKSGSSSEALPLNNTTYMPDYVFGNGDQIGTTGWYCIYNGSADSAKVMGLAPGYSYTLHIIEYIGSPGNERYYKELRSDNIGVFGTSIFTEETGISFSGTTSFTDSKIAWGDYDNDGYLDILIPSSWSHDGFGTKIYRNNGNNIFTEQTGILLPNAKMAVWGDYNNDGNLDILLSGQSYDYPVTTIYRNNGDNTFTEQTHISFIEIYGLESCAWGDYDNDGYLDIVLTGWDNTHNSISKIYRNNGGNTFTEQTDIPLQGVLGGSALWADYDNDGNPDLLLTGEGISRLYRNNGDNSFSLSDVSLPYVNRGTSAWGDFNNDGYLDLLISGSSITYLYRNNGNGTFTRQMDISLPGVSEGGVAWGDFDNDGYLDIALTGESASGYITKIYRNNGNNTFTEVTGVSLTGVYSSSLTWGDYDNDGDLDLIICGYSVTGDVAKIYRNNTIMKAGNYQPNRNPDAPEGLSHSVMPNRVQLNWEPITSDETPASAMAYNVRLQQKGSDNWVAGHMAGENGFRRLPAMGNAQLGTNYIFNNLPSDTYLWQVQAVDQGYKGSEWSELGEFTVKTLQTFFESTIECHTTPTSFNDLSVSTNSISSWHWDFGDGVFSNEQSPTHTFENPGEHIVKLLIIDSEGIKDSLTQTILVKPKPLANFTATTVCQGQETTLANLTNTLDLDITGWVWDYGDGKGSTLQTPPPHGYINPGNYQVGLYVTASNGCQGSVINTVSVGAIPSASLSANAPLTFCQGQSVTLEVPFGESLTYQWRDNGVNITGANSHTYIASRSGSFSAQVVNPVGQCFANSTTSNVTAHDMPPIPTIAEATNTTNFCLGTLVTLQVTNPSQLYSYKWKRSGVEIAEANLQSYSGTLTAGDYSAVAVDGLCSSESNILTLTTKPAPTKPEIFARGPNVWVLGCSNETATAYRWFYNDALIPGANAHTYVANQNLGNYFVMVNEGGECWTATDVINIPTGTIVGIDNNLKPKEVVVFPNPSTGIFNVNLGATLPGKTTVRVTDALGRLVLTQEHSNVAGFTVDLSTAHKGVYYCRIEYGKIHFTTKLLRE